MGDSFDALAARITTPETRFLGDQVVNELRVWIIKAELEPGTHLVEAQLSSAFGVSRGPIRDALAQLEAEGLVESRKRGTFVSGLSLKDIDELYSIREAIELLALQTADRLEAPQWSLAEGPLRVMAEAAAAGDHLAFAHADMSFHKTFYDVAGNSRLAKIWSQYEPTFSVLLELTTAEDVDLGPSYDSHAVIFEKMRGHDLADASLTLREHLLGSRNRLVSAFARATMADAEPDAQDGQSSTRKASK
jgi:GntR family transcriptional regulator of gluconate operon